MPEDVLLEHYIVNKKIKSINQSPAVPPIGAILITLEDDSILTIVGQKLSVELISKS